jgi:hypothetical protein
MAVDKSTWNKKVKVSQSTIDDIKKLGMTKALKLAKQNAGATQGGLVKEYQEATRRLYGDKRFSAATKGATPAPAKKGSYQAGSAKSGKATYTTGSGVKYKASGTPAAKPAAKPTTTKATAKKDNTKANLLKGVAGTAAAVGLLVVGRGKGAGTIAKLSPQVGRALNSPVGRLLTGTVEKTKTTAASTSGRVAAKVSKTVSQSQYDAMKAAAAAKGIKPIALSKNVGATATSKAPAKLTIKKTAAPAASKAKAAVDKLTARGNARWDANAAKAKAPKPPKK